MEDFAWHPEGRPLPCPHCAYDLRASESRVCPECGRGFDPGALQWMATIPWVHRRSIGRMRALQRTVVMVVFRTARTARESVYDLPLADARRFRLACVLLAGVPLALAAGGAALLGLRRLAGSVAVVVEDLNVSGEPVAAGWGWMADLAVAITAMAGVIVWLYVATGLPGYFFTGLRGRGLPAPAPERLLALSYLGAAPLAAVPGVVAWTALLMLAPAAMADFYRLPVVVQGVWLGVVLLPIGAVVLATWIVPIRLLAHAGGGVHGSPLRVAALALTTLITWPGLLWLVAFGLPWTVVHLQLVFLAWRILP